MIANAHHVPIFCDEGGCHNRAMFDVLGHYGERIGHFCGRHTRDHVDELNEDADA